MTAKCFRLIGSRSNAGNVSRFVCSTSIHPSQWIASSVATTAIGNPITTIKVHPVPTWGFEVGLPIRSPPPRHAHIHTHVRYVPTWIRTLDIKSRSRPAATTVIASGLFVGPASRAESFVGATPTDTVSPRESERSVVKVEVCKQRKQPERNKK